MSWNDSNELPKPSVNIDETQDIGMALQSEPYKPDDNERDGYYFGFAGNPRLVARTSNNRWSEPRKEAGWGGFAGCLGTVPIRKQYLPIVQQEIVSKWTKDLSLAIIKALDQCAWTYFFPIRIGLQERFDDDIPLSEPSTVLLVAVEEDSLGWEEGIAIALECREILQSSKISNVEVEIREGRHVHHAASTQLDAQVDTEYWDSLTNEAILPMLSSLGYTIGYLEDRRGQGTVGLHLSLEDDELTVYGLTCRHVVYNGRAPHETYELSGESRQYHVQASDLTLSDCLQRLKSIQESLEGEIRPLQELMYRTEKWYSLDETTKHKCATEKDVKALLDLQSRASYNTNITKLLKTITEKKERTIGHLAFHSNFEVSSRRPGYLKDWALIKLDPNKFIGGPENKVFIDSNAARHFSSQYLEKGLLPQTQIRG